MDKSEYTGYAKLVVLLNNIATYKKIVHKNPISSVERNWNSFIWNLYFKEKNQVFSVQISA